MWYVLSDVKIKGKSVFLEVLKENVFWFGVVLVFMSALKVLTMLEILVLASFTWLFLSFDKIHTDDVWASYAKLICTRRCGFTYYENNHTLKLEVPGDCEKIGVSLLVTHDNGRPILNLKTKTLVFGSDWLKEQQGIQDFSVFHRVLNRGR